MSTASNFLASNTGTKKRQNGWIILALLFLTLLVATTVYFSAGPKTTGSTIITTETLTINGHTIQAVTATTTIVKKTATVGRYEFNVIQDTKSALCRFEIWFGRKLLFAPKGQACTFEKFKSQLESQSIELPEWIRDIFIQVARHWLP